MSEEERKKQFNKLGKNVTSKLVQNFKKPESKYYKEYNISSGKIIEKVG